MPMASHWPSYSLILLAAVLGLLVPVVLPKIWGFGRKKTANPGKVTPDEGSKDGKSPPIAIRFHLAALLFLGFFGLTLLMLPLLFGVHTSSGLQSVAALLGVTAPTLVALFYVLRKGDLSWGILQLKEEIATEDEGDRR